MPLRTQLHLKANQLAPSGTEGFLRGSLHEECKEDLDDPIYTEKSLREEQ